MDKSSSPSPLHIAICPWPAFGHLLPCLELAERLASRGHRVSFVSTPRNIARLPRVRPSVAPLVDLVSLPLPRVDGLPDGLESTNDVPYEMYELHRRAFDGLGAPFSEFLGACGKKPDWVIVDNYCHWAAAAAIEHKVPCALLVLGAATLFAVWTGRMPLHAQPPRFETERTEVMTTRRASGMSSMERFTLTLQRCNLVAIRSCLEWEPESVPLLPTLGGKPVVPLGLLPPPPPPAGASEDTAVRRWLDEQPASSVVYVALGSEAPLCVEQLHELALGLDLAGTPFLWALRKPHGVADADLLPTGFEERTRSRGLVLTGWVPQISVLAHPAVGAFLTHCGCSSIIEGLFFGHPLIMLPILGDQGPNARLMEGRKVGLQVARNENDGSFDRGDVAGAVRAVVVEEETRRIFVANAKKMQEIVADSECHERYIDAFILQLTSYQE